MGLHFAPLSVNMLYALVPVSGPDKGIGESEEISSLDLATWQLAPLI